MAGLALLIARRRGWDVRGRGWPSSLIARRRGWAVRGRGSALSLPGGVGGT